MFIVGILQWWYTDGWRRQVTLLRSNLDRMLDFFSISLLFKTMFSLFRQDGAGAVNGPLSVKLHAFFERLISRMLGAIIRLTVLIVGCVAIAVTAVGGVLALAMWGVVPFMPLIGTVLTLTEWMPWR